MMALTKELRFTFVMAYTAPEFIQTLNELADWRGNRADAGRLAPKGFPRSNTFGQVRANGNGEGR